MKFLHLSDLHIGKSVNGFSMLNEQRHVLAQVLGYIQEKKPSAVIIAGDIYDKAIPNIEAVCVFDDFLTKIAKENVAVLLISGNHDSPERLSYASRLLCDKKVFLCGTFDGFMQKVVFEDEHGDINFWLLPFIKPSSVRGQFTEYDIESYDDAIKAVLKTTDVDYSKRNVLVAHQFFTKYGVESLLSDSEMNPIGGLDAIDVGVVEGFDYVALGHLHGSQKVGSEYIRYAGSPLKYSFSEVAHKKSIMLVEMNEKGSVEIERLPLIPIHDMREIRGEIERLTSDEVTSLADKEDYLRVTLTDEEEIIDPIGKIRSVYPNVMLIDFDNSRTNIDIFEISPDAGQVAKASLYDMFGDFFQKANESAMSEEQSRIVKELLEEGVE